MTPILLAGVLLAASPAAPTSFSGAWKVDSSVGTTPIVVHCMLIQTGSALSGACAPAGGEPTALTGTVEGSSAQWGYDVTFRGQPGHVGFKAEIKSASSMSGVLDLSGRPSPFTAAKQ
jgi:hypothetical protein